MALRDGTRGARPGGPRAVRAALAAVTVAGLGLTACSSDTDPQLCAGLDRLAEQVDELGVGAPSDLPSGVPQEQLDEAEAALDELASLGDSADGRVGAAIDALESELRDYADALRSGSADARAAAEESWDQVQEGWAALGRAMEAHCGTAATPG
ncbi:hypothetical protein [Puerhibacterium sp. TATVAM-FAB25]|uniref:hypothetical protein n=1 Tax=Puerhibacterium sp. TATVAM-FAB25 TaxID=3093699 RepID=UPI0039798140